ncbi:MAG: BatD family protein [Candidatus Binatia bacterium]
MPRYRHAASFPGRLSRRAIVALMVGCFAGVGAARADLSVDARVSPQRAEVGEALTLSITIRGSQSVAAPAINDLDGFDVQYVGPSTQISIINTRVTASVEHTYSLLPLRPGHFTLGPFSVAYQGRTYRTAALGVDIVPAAKPPAPPVARQAKPQPAPAARGTGPRAQQALHLALAAPRRPVYLHERVPVDVTLYVGSIRVTDVQFPALPGHGLSIDKFGQPSRREQVINGQRFKVLHFQTTVIPLRTGPLALGPATLRLNVLERRRGTVFNDPFFDRFFQSNLFTTQRRPLDVRSDSLTLTVLPLPKTGRPAAFSGAVGTFTMEVTAAPTQLNAGDPITLHMALTGRGNLTDARPPELANSEGFRTYEPRVTRSEGGSKSFEQVLIPHDAQVEAVPAVRFSYFDPQARRYRTLRSQPIALVVRPPQHAQRAEIIAGGASGARVAAQEKLGRDIVYIKDDPGHLARPAAAWYRSVPFLCWQPLPLLLLAGAVWYERRRERLTGDLRYARFTRAGKSARRGLAVANQALAGQDRVQFYDAVSRTLREYLAAKLDLPPGGVDATSLGSCGVPEACAQRLRELFATCEQVRFAPSSGDGDMRGTLALAQDVIRQLEREWRRGPERPRSTVHGSHYLATTGRR